jgi:enoyl-CoA hydratase/carnithine racemase
MSGLRTEVDARVLTVTLDRPQARNALDRALILALTELMRRVAEDDAVDVVVVTGTDPAFCAGLDVKQLQAEGQDFLRFASAPETNPFHAVRDCPKPVIAAVNGPAVAAGLELALACDIVVASERATFVDPHARLGYVSVQGLSAALVQALGPSLARGLSFTGNPIDAATALRAGLPQPGRAARRAAGRRAEARPRRRSRRSAHRADDQGGLPAQPARSHRGPGAVGDRPGPARGLNDCQRRRTKFVPPKGLRRPDSASVSG